MTTVLALPTLYSDVATDLAAVYALRAGAPTAPTMAFGWREPSKHLGAAAVIFEPGDDGAIGEIGPARNPGRNPRPLATIHEAFTVYVKGFDSSSPEDELKQYTAARLLLDDVLASIYRVAHGTIELGRPAWIETQNVRRHGATIRLVCSVQAMVPDEESATAPADAHAAVTSYESADGLEGETDTVSAA